MFAFCYLLVRFRSPDLPTERSSSLEVRGSWSSSLPEEDEELSEGPFSSQIYKSSSSRCRPAHAFGLPLVFALSFYTRRQNLEKEKKNTNQFAYAVKKINSPSRYSSEGLRISCLRTTRFIADVSKGKFGVARKKKAVTGSRSRPMPR